jgi:hypothetical protein
VVWFDSPGYNSLAMCLEFWSSWVVGSIVDCREFGRGKK